MLRRLFAPKLSLSRPLSAGRAADRALRFESLEGRALLSATAAGDFNGDGRADLATGLPYEDLVVAAVTEVDAGLVHIQYGTAAGLASADNQIWHQNSPRIGDQVESGDRFGWAVAAGDFNGDGIDDLAISAPGEDFNGHSSAGVVHILYGTLDGLVSPAMPGADLIHQDKPQMLDVAEDGDSWGWTLTAGDFNGDGRDDLAVGAPFEVVNAHDQGGLVQVMYGTGDGITAAGNQVWHQDKPNVADSVEDFDRFGDALAAGDFDGDGDDDLAIGVPFDGIIGAPTIGTVHVLNGTTGGLTATDSQYWHQNRPGIHEQAEGFDLFGASLAAGDYNGDGKDDLAIGVPNEATSFVSAGAFHVLYGTAASLSSTGAQLFHQNTPGVLDQNESGDNFAFALQTGDYNGDGKDDLAVGAPSEGWAAGNAIEDAGVVHVFYGTNAGIAVAGTQLWHQNVPAILDVIEDDDRFGYYLAAGDFDGDGRDDLAIDVPSEDLGSANSIQNAGALHAIYGTINGLSSDRNQFWHQNSPGILDSADRGDGYPTFDAIVPAIAPASAAWWISPDSAAAPATTRKASRVRSV